MDSVEQLKARLDAILERTGKTHTDVWSALPMTESGYFKMWRRGSIDVRTLLGISRITGVDACELLGISRLQVAQLSTAAEPAAEYGTGTFIEQRIERLEVELRKLREQVRALQH